VVFKCWKHFRDGEMNMKNEPHNSRGQNCLFHPEACSKWSAAHFQEVDGVELLQKRDCHHTCTKFQLGVVW